MSWVYLDNKRSAGVYTVAHLGPDGEWTLDSDHAEREDAARRCHYLNGGCDSRCNQPIPPVGDDEPYYTPAADSLPVEELNAISLAALDDPELEGPSWDDPPDEPRRRSVLSELKDDAGEGSGLDTRIVDR